MPDRGRNASELSLGSEVEIQQHEREITIAEEEVGALDRLHRFPTADPEKATTFLRPIRTRIKGIPPINKR